MTETEFQDIIAQTKSAVLASIARTLPPEYHHSIDDIVQETYLRAFRRIEKVGRDSIESLHAYLYTIARNESLRLLGRLKKREVGERAAFDVRNPAQPDVQVTKVEVQDFREKIDDLPERYSTVLTLAVEGYSEREIATELDIKRGTVKSRLSRAREMFRNMMSGGRPT